LPLPGIEVGDIGTKMGYNSMDNGFLSFNQVKIPKENMLARFAGLDEEGNFEIRGDLRSLYLTMV
jgi:acyl-CoA oxidase